MMITWGPPQGWVLPDLCISPEGLWFQEPVASLPGHRSGCPRLLSFSLNQIIRASGSSSRSFPCCSHFLRGTRETKPHCVRDAQPASPRLTWEFLRERRRGRPCHFQCPFGVLWSSRKTPSTPQPAGPLLRGAQEWLHFHHPGISCLKQLLGLGLTLLLGSELPSSGPEQ